MLCKHNLKYISDKYHFTKNIGKILNIKELDLKIKILDRTKISAEKFIQKYKIYDPEGLL